MLDTPGRLRRCRRLKAALCAVTVVAVAIALVLARGLAPSGEGGLVGEPAPGFVLPGLAAGSKPVKLDSFLGRPMVINFWASWCVPCRQEMPDLQAAHILLGEQVGFVGVVHGDLRSAALDFVLETGVTYPAGFDPAGNVAASYGLIGLPSTFLVAADGVIVAEARGELTEDELLELVAERLGISV